MTERIKVIVRGSEDEPYRVVITRADGGFTATCTCKAGRYGQWCKHRLWVLRGETKGVVAGDVAAAVALIAGSDIELLLADYAEADAEMARVKRRRDGLVGRLKETFGIHGKPK